jgi:hypothetical protein
MSDGNDQVYWWDGAHWQLGIAPVPDAPGPPIPGGVWYCGPNTIYMTEAGQIGQHLVSHGADAPTWEWPITSTEWVEVELLNGWVNYGLGYETAAYCLGDDDFVEFKGYIKGGKTAMPVFVLPQQLSPSLQVPRMVLSNNNGNARVDVAKTGNVYVQSYQGTGNNKSVSIGGIRFRVAA